MINYFKSLTDIQKLKSSILIPIALVSLVLFILPKEIYTYIGIEEIYKWRWVLVIVFIISFVIIISRTLDYILNQFEKNKKIQEQKKDNIKLLSQLDPLEKAYIKAYFDDNRNTLTFDLANPTIDSLIRKDVLFVVNNYVVIRHEIHCTLNSELKELIDPKTFFNEI